MDKPETLESLRRLALEVERAMREPGSYAFLPEILDALKVMQGSLSLASERRRKMAGALGHLIMESYTFSESPLGTKLLRVVDDFAAKRE